MNVVGKLVDELRENPERFRDNDGYDRLLSTLRAGNDPNALKQALRVSSDLAGDMLWVVAELETVECFVREARTYLSSPDKGAAAYAMEIVLRGGQERADVRAAFEQLRECDVTVCAHAVRTLQGVGITRLIAVLQAAGFEWSCALAKQLAPSMEPLCRNDIEGLIERLVMSQLRDRQVVGLALATFVWEQDPTHVSFFLCSDEAWIREYGSWLKDLHKPLELNALDSKLKSLGIYIKE